jgi:tryptophan-rich sensory protein
MKKTFDLILAVLICQGMGLIGSLFTTPAIPSWYAGLIKPSFNPPNWIFAPAWILLYTLMGIAAFLIWNRRNGKKKIKTALVLFSVQLVLNSLWSIIFFGLHLPQYAFLEILVLWFFILLTLLSFYKISKPAGLLLLPYILWVSFATILNLSIMILNW